MNKAALAVVFKDIGWFVQEPEYAQKVQAARALVERGIDSTPGGPGGVLDTARRVVAAADLPEGQLPAAASSSVPASGGETSTAGMAAKVAALGISVPQVNAWATANGRDPTEALAAAIESAEQLARDKAVLAPDYASGGGR